jgi:hypothetical protein
MDGMLVMTICFVPRSVKTGFVKAWPNFLALRLERLLGGFSKMLERLLGGIWFRMFLAMVSGAGLVCLIWMQLGKCDCKNLGLKVRDLEAQVSIIKQYETLSLETMNTLANRQALIMRYRVYRTHIDNVLPKERGY